MMVLVFLLEEPSAKIMLEGVLPKVLPPAVDVHYMVFEGKQDLHKRMVMCMQYWQKPDSRFIVLCDQDNANCHQVRQELAQLCVHRPVSLMLWCVLRAMNWRVFIWVICQPLNAVWV